MDKKLVAKELLKVATLLTAWGFGVDTPTKEQIQEETERVQRHIHQLTDMSHKKDSRTGDPLIRNIDFIHIMKHLQDYLGAVKRGNIDPTFWDE